MGGRAGAAMRLLPVGDDHGGGRIAQIQSAPGCCRDPRRGNQPLPLRHLSQDCRGHRAGYKLEGLAMGRGTGQVSAMAQSPPWQPLSAFARREWHEISRVNSSPRPWQMPFVAGLTSAAPVALGLWLDAFAQGLMAALGTMVFVYLTNARMERRLLTLMTVSFAITACFALGLIAAQIHFAPVPVIIAVGTLVSMGCRYLRQGPPAAMFPVMACAIGLFSRTPWEHVAEHVGILFLGA
ncbi:hypothetical protein KXV85_001622, partial [Aspergillus fumigatus]